MNSHALTRLRQVAGADVSRETLNALAEIERLIRLWNARTNLIAPSTLNEIWERHILDSAQLSRYAAIDTTWLDLGSGAGFPGLVIAALQLGGAGRVELIESNRKKAAFLQAAKISAHLPARIWPRRIEAMTHLSVSVVSARALAPLPRLLNLAAPWLANGAKGLFHKGKENVAEVEACLPLWSFELLKHQSAVDPQGVILEIFGLKRR